MAKATWSDISKEHVNFIRLSKLVIDGGTQALREVFDKFHPPQLLRSHLLGPKIYQILKRLKAMRIITSFQWQLLYPVGGSMVESKNFHSTLLIILLQYICKMPQPIVGWNTPPLPTCSSLADDIVRMRFYYNNLVTNARGTAISDSDFSRYWDEITEVLIRIGGLRYQAEIDKLKVLPLYQGDDTELRSMEEFEKDDEEENGKDNSGAPHTALHQYLKVDQKKLDENLREIKTTVMTVHLAEDSKIPEHEMYSRILKETTKKRLEMPQVFAVSPFVDKSKIEDIFTNLQIKCGRRESPRDKGQIPADPPEHTNITKSEDLFLVNKDSTKNPKSILVEGCPGIGKSLFCKKLVQEWAQDKIFDHNRDDVPDFKFTFLVTLRHLNVLGERHINIVDLLNLSSMIDQDVMINNSIIEYVLQHPEELLLIFDGYDEYQDRQKMGSVLENVFASDPKEKMPAPVLISKILRKKMLIDSVVMVTSRPAQTNDFNDFQFDRYVVIDGFSGERIEEYVRKHFKGDEQMEALVLDCIAKNQYLLGFGRVPLLCSLMSVYLEKNIQKSAGRCFPNRLTSFYSEVLEFVDENSFGISRDDRGLDDMAEKVSVLAANLILEERYSFYEEDLKELDLSEEEKSLLLSSNLLFCDASAKGFTLSGVTPNEYSFLHKTFQEYLAARHFVQIRQVPTQGGNLNEMTMVFMAGLMKPVEDSVLMDTLLEYIDGHVKNGKQMTLKCLYEYRDRDFMKNVVQKNVKDRYWDSSQGWIDLCKVDCKVTSMLVDVISLLNKEQSFVSSVAPHTLCTWYVPLTCSDSIETLFKSLNDEFCPITELQLYDCSMDDKGAECLSEYLPQTNITHLDLSWNEISTSGAVAILLHCNKVVNLQFRKNRISNGVNSFRLPQSNKLTCLDLGGNEMTDEALYSILPYCDELTSLDLTLNKITDVGAKFVLPYCKNLKHLELTSNQLTDKGVLSILPFCTRLAYVNLSGNDITSECKRKVEEHLFVYPNVRYYI